MDWSTIGSVAATGFQALGNIGNSKKSRQAAADMNNANIAFQQQLNADNRQFSQDMWDKTNAYNSPAQVMARFKEAGLNPHLIYGSQPQASQPMSASTKAPTVEALPIDRTVSDLGTTMMQGAQNYLANKMQQAQINNLEKTSQVMDADINTKNASIAESISRTARSKYDLELAQELRGNIVQDAIYGTQSKGLDVQKTEQEIRNSIKSGQLTDAQIQKAAQEIEQSKASIKMMQMQGENLKADNELKRLDLQLKRLGIQPSDSPLFRIPIQTLSDPDLRNKVGTKFKNWWSK